MTRLHFPDSRFEPVYLAFELVVTERLIVEWVVTERTSRQDVGGCLVEQRGDSFCEGLLCIFPLLRGSILAVDTDALLQSGS